MSMILSIGIEFLGGGGEPGTMTNKKEGSRLFS